MKRNWLLAVPLVLCFSCGHKKTVSASSDEIVDVHDFISVFRTLKLPYQFSDTILKHHEGDSLISSKTVARFIPDTVFSLHFGKAVRPKVYALGRSTVRRNESYLFVRAVTPSKRIVYVLCFDKSNKFATAMPLLATESDPTVSWTAGMDSKYTISIMRQRKTAAGELYYRKWAYVYNDAGTFTLILEESNETAPQNRQVFNPIDTLPHKHKFTGDYMQDKRNFISVRDGRNNSYVLVFVHFEKNDGDCKGELKGEARFTGPSTARYSANSDPCLVDFYFTENGVRMKELEGCGNHRDIKCFFDGFYPRKKETKSKQARKKKTDGR